MRLRHRVWSALETAGLEVDPTRFERLLRGYRLRAEPLATELIDLLEARARPEDDTDFSLLVAVETMTAFACVAADYAYRNAAAETYVHEVERGVAVFVVATAIFDRVCDREPHLLPAVEEHVSRRWVRAALRGDAPGDPLVGAEGAVRLAYLGALLGEAAALWRRLAWLTDRGPLRADVTDWLTAAYRAERASLRSRDVETIWATPFWVALALVALTPDAVPGFRVEAFLPQTRRIGRLLALIDDVADLEDDWASGSSNQYLERAGVTHRERGGDLPWDVLLADDVCRPYLAEIVTLLRSVSSGIDRDTLAACVLYWLSG
jgi:hypothetical protein